MNKYVLTSVLCLLLFIVAIVMRFATVQKTTLLPGALPTMSVSIGNTDVEAEVASTPAQQEQGLSGRASLASGTGMLFVFPQEENDGFWMKDMQFPIDIIWADKNGKIVTIVHNLSPNTYPMAFYPTSPAMYTLEVPAGFADAHGITEGNIMTFQ